MKIVKLLLVFIVILGGVVGAFYLIGGATTSGLEEPSDDTYQTYREQFENDWRNKGDWSDSLFSAHCDMIRMLSREFNVAPLKDLNTTAAVEVVHNRIFKQWESATCSKTIIENYIQALGKIQAEDENAKSNPNIQKINSVYDTYKKAYALAHRSIGLSPSVTFKPDTIIWNSFTSYNNSMLTEKSTILNNNNFTQYLANIKDIKDGIDAIPSELDNARTRFYNELASEIVNHYRSIPQASRTRSQLNELRDARNKFNGEAPSKNSNLQNFCNTFNGDVDRNESNGNN